MGATCIAAVSRIVRRSVARCGPAPVCMVRPRRISIGTIEWRRTIPACNGGRSDECGRDDENPSDEVAFHYVPPIGMNRTAQDITPATFTAAVDVTGFCSCRGRHSFRNVLFIASILRMRAIVDTARWLGRRGVVALSCCRISLSFLIARYFSTASRLMHGEHDTQYSMLHLKERREMPCLPQGRPMLVCVRNSPFVVERALTLHAVISITLRFPVTR